MDRSEAEAVIAVVQAFFPRPELPESTVLAWASELEALGDLTVEEARQAVVRMAWAEKYPSLRALMEGCREIVAERQSERVLVGRPWTQEDERMSMEIGARVLRQWREARGR